MSVDRPSLPLSAATRWYELPPKTALRVSGADAIEFLQGQMGTDLSGLDPAHWAPASFHDRSGRVQELGDCWIDAGAVYLLVAAARVDQLVTGLARYVLRAKVSFEALPAAWDMVGAVLEPGEFGARRSVGPLIGLARGGDRWLLAGPTAAIATARAQLHDTLGPAADASAWRRAEIAAGVAELHAAGQGRFLPQMLNLDVLGGVSFTKGCYIGQEVIVRTQHRGRLKRRLQRLAATAGAAPGAAVTTAAGKKAGEVVTCAGVPGDYELLAVLQLGLADDELRLQDGPPLARLALPYDPPAGAV